MHNKCTGRLSAIPMFTESATQIITEFFPHVSLRGVCVSSTEHITSLLPYRWNSYTVWLLSSLESLETEINLQCPWEGYAEWLVPLSCSQNPGSLTVFSCISLFSCLEQGKAGMLLGCLLRLERIVQQHCLRWCRKLSCEYCWHLSP